MFRILLPLLLLGLQYMLYTRVRRWIRGRFPDKPWVHAISIVLFLLFNIAFIVVALTRPRLLDVHPLLLWTGVYPFYIWHGATFFIGLVIVLGYVLSAPGRVGLYFGKKLPAVSEGIEVLAQTTAFQQFNSTRRLFLKTGMYTLTAASFAGSSYGVLYGRSRYETTTAEFLLPSLPLSLHGFTIGLMSDIHSSAFMTKEDMDEYVAAMNNLNTDLIVVTGDFVNSMVDEVYPFAESFSALQAPHGVFGVMGNHDFFVRDPDKVAREIDDCGVKLLRDDRVRIDKDGGSFWLLGVDDVGRPERARERFDVVAQHTSPTIPRILLCHRPYFLQQAAEAGMDLVLSGHTHGGQVSLGKFRETHIAPASIASRYVWGTYTIGQTKMYVSRGIGTVGLPIRINCPPEITTIRLLSPLAS